MHLLVGLERTDNNMDLTTWPQINPINQKNYYTYVATPMAGAGLWDLSRCSPCLRGLCTSIIRHSAKNQCLAYYSTDDPTRSDYLKRDDQILPLRLLQEERRNRMTAKAKDRDRELAQANPNEAPPSGADMDMDDDAGMEDAGEPLTGQDALGSKVIVIHPGSQNLRIGLASDALPRTVPMVIARKWQMSESEEDGGEPSPKRRRTDDDAQMEPEEMFGEEASARIRYDNSSTDSSVVRRPI